MNPKKDSTSAGSGTNQSGSNSGNTGGSTPTPPAGEPDYDQPSGD
jgi:hypothetical protein